MSAERLREAAALMRSRAEAARAGEWYAVPSVMVPDASLVLARWENEPRRVATCAGSLPEGNEANAAHIASWHPAVALAVADWLEDVAVLMACDNCTSPLSRCRDAKTVRGKVACCPECAHSKRALAVANAYLGSDQ